jgi:Lrp/AsnC family transcriptional regulator for asnA, asnC and gidA
MSTLPELLDEKDLKIIEILVKNARTPYVDIAKEVGISDVAIIKRVKRLESLGVIKKYTVVLDPKKLNYNAVSIIGIDVEPQYLYDVINELRNKDYVKYLSLTSGDHSIIAVIWARDNDEMARINKEIASITGVKKVCPSLILEVIKD